RIPGFGGPCVGALGTCWSSLGVPYAIRHPLLPRDDAGSLGASSLGCPPRLPLSLRCRPACAQGHGHSGRRMASCRRRCARNTGANGTPSRGRKSRLEPLRRPSTGLGTPLTAAACWPTYRVSAVDIFFLQASETRVGDLP